MSTGLLNQLDTYFSDVDAEQGPVTPERVAELLDRVRELPPDMAPVRSAPRLRVAVAAAAVVLLLVGAVSWLLGSGDDTVPPATEPPVSTTTSVTTSTSGPTPSTVPNASSVSPHTLTWEQVTFDPEDGPQHGDLRAGTDQFLVLQPGYEGSDPVASELTDPDGDPRTILWTSTDTFTWESHHLPQFDGTRPRLIGEAHGTYVIQGRVESEIYTSTDLENWTLRDPRSDLPYGFRNMAVSREVVAGTVIGSATGSIVVFDPGFDQMEIVDAPFGVESDASVWNLVSTADRFYALVQKDNPLRWEVWTSQDAINWTAEPMELGFEPVIAANEARVLVYSGGITSGPFWTAESGGTFARASGPTGPGEIDILATNSGFAAIFTGGFGAGAIRANGPYTTVDGTEWSPPGETTESFAGWAAVDDTVFAATGKWTVEFNEEGLVASESWSPTGGWLIGTNQR